MVKGFYARINGYKSDLEEVMSEKPDRPRGWYFEEYEEGAKIMSAGRTVTETDIVNFAGLSGDYNYIHTDAEAAKQTPVGERMAHGLLGFSIASGLAVQTGIMEGTIMAFREISKWKFVNPILIGDTIRVDMQVTETKPIPRLGGGMVSIEMTVINQKDETVMKGTWKVLINGKPKD